MLIRRWILVLAAVAAPLAAEPVRHKVILSGNEAGFETVDKSKDGLKIHFEYNDRGRGPKIDATYRLSVAGLPVAVTIDGVEYMKGAVAERFSIEKGQARWTNRAEAGGAPAAPAAFYSSFDGPPQELALLAAAAFSTPGGELALWPSGTVKASFVDKRTLTPTKGKPVEARYIELDGLGFGPTGLWLDGNGEFVAQVSAWMTIVREGLEGGVADLLKFQNERTTKRDHDLAATLAKHPPAAGLVIRHARLFDSEARQTRENWSVVVIGDRIVAAGPDAEIATPDGAQLLDASGQTLLPGLWDLHTHVSSGDGLLHLAAGVTGVRDLANDLDTVVELRRQWEAGDTLGPHLVLAGFLDGPGPYAGPSKALVSTFDEAKPWIDKYLAQGYIQLKLYSSLKPELVAPIAAYGHSKGMRVSGHIPAFMTAEQAVRAGYDEIHHVNMLFLNFLFDQVQDTRTPARFTAVAEHAAELDLDSQAVRGFLDLLYERGVVLDPTVGIFEGMFLGRAGVVPPGFAAVADRLPVQVRRGMLGGGLPVLAGMDSRYRASFAKALELVAHAWRRGIRIVAGTDDLAGFALHRELELYQQAGIPAPEVLALATFGAAQVAGKGRDSGSIRPGKWADLVLVAGAPDRDVADIRHLRTVIRAGVPIEIAAIDRALGVRPETP
jgi:hypothetical protein